MIKFGRVHNSSEVCTNGEIPVFSRSYIYDEVYCG